MYEKTKIMALFLVLGAVLVTRMIAIPEMEEADATTIAATDTPLHQGEALITIGAKNADPNNSYRLCAGGLKIIADRGMTTDNFGCKGPITGIQLNEDKGYKWTFEEKKSPGLKIMYACVIDETDTTYTCDVSSSPFPDRELLLELNLDLPTTMDLPSGFNKVVN